MLFMFPSVEQQQQHVATCSGYSLPLIVSLGRWYRMSHSFTRDEGLNDSARTPCVSSSVCANTARRAVRTKLSGAFKGSCRGSCGSWGLPSSLADQGQPRRVTAPLRRPHRNLQKVIQGQTSDAAHGRQKGYECNTDSKEQPRSNSQLAKIFLEIIKSNGTS
jgi:hypothetical protein